MMDPEIVQQLNDQLKEMADLLSTQSTLLAAQIKATNNSTSAATEQTAATKKLKDSTDNSSAATTGNTAKMDAASKSTALTSQATTAFSTAGQQGKKAILTFASAVLDATPGVSKYSSGIKGGIDAVGGLASIFGPLGKVTQLFLGFIGEAVGASLKYSDNVVRTYDDVAKAGAGLGNSAEHLMDLAHKAGLFSRNTELLTKNITALGPNLLNLGNTSSSGADTFARMIDVGDKNLQKYRKLGYTQERLIDSQAKYVELQAQAGANMRKSPEELQKGSLAYIDNLNKLAELTGLNEKKQQELLEQAQAQENFNAHIAELEADKQAALDKGDTAKADEIAKVIQAKKNYAMFAEQFGPEKAKGILELISSKEDPAITESSAAIVRSMPGVLQDAKDMNKGQERFSNLIDENAEAVQHYSKMFGEQATSMGEASRTNMKLYGQDNESRAMEARYRNKSAAERLALAKQLQKEEDDKKNQDKGIIAQRAAIESQERTLRITFDSIMAQLAQRLNDMITKFIPMVTNTLSFIVDHGSQIQIAVEALTVAFGVLAGVAGIAKIVNIGRSVKDFVKTLFGLHPGKVGSESNPAYIKLLGSSSSSAFPKLRKADFLDKNGKLLGGASLDSRLAKLGVGAAEEVSADIQQDGTIGGIVNALKDASKDAGPIIKGGAALGTSLALIGGGAALGIWVVGKALPTFTDGLKSFNKVNGPNLKGVGIGMLGITGGIMLWAAGTGLRMFVSLFTKGNPLQDAANSLVEFQRLPINANIIKDNGEAAMAFSKAIAGASAIGGFSKISEAISGFFSKKPPYQDFEDFAEMEVNAKKVQNNALAFKYFSEAISAYGGTLEVGGISSAIANAVIKHFAIPLPIDQFKYFADQRINPEQARKNSLAFKYFSEAMAEYKGTNQGVLDALNVLVGGQISKLFDPSGPIKSFQDFTNMPFGQYGASNAKAFLQFAQALNLLAGGSGDPNNSGGGVLSTVGNIASTVIGGAVNLGATALGAIGGAIGGIIGKIIHAESGGNANAQAKTSSAYGLGQFTKSTFEGVARQKGSPVYGMTWEQYKADPKVQMAALNYLVSQDIAFLNKNGIPVSATSIYLSHFLGLGGVRNLYRHPNQSPISEAVSSAAYNANLSVFAKAGTVGGLKEWAGKKMGEPLNISQAKLGGIFTGPESGYVMELHGTEIVVPIDKNSILKVLAELSPNEPNNTEALHEALHSMMPAGSEIANVMQSTSGDLVELDNEMREMMLLKFSKMLYVLDSKQSVSNKMLRTLL